MKTKRRSSDTIDVENERKKLFIVTGTTEMRATLPQNGKLLSTMRDRNKLHDSSSRCRSVSQVMRLYAVIGIWYAINIGNVFIIKDMLDVRTSTIAPLTLVFFQSLVSCILDSVALTYRGSWEQHKWKETVLLLLPLSTTYAGAKVLNFTSYRFTSVSLG